MLGNGASHAIRFGGNLALTRLLAPEAFGVMAIVWMVLSGLWMLTDTGIRQCIVRSPNGDDPRFLDTAWSIQIARGVVLTLSAIAVSACLALAARLGSVPEGNVYSDSDLPLVMAVAALSMLISGFESTRLATASRNLALARVTAMEVGGQLIGLAAMLAWAMVNPTVWALVAGVLIVGPLKVAFSHLALPGPGNRLRWHAESAREILAFGKWIMLSSLLGFLAVSGDRILLGGLIDANLLGQYSIAFLIINALQLLIAAVISSVTLAALGEVWRNDPARIQSAFYRLRLPIDAALMILIGLLFATGTTLIDMLYDDRYRLAGPLVEILALSLFATRYEVANQCYLALGKSALITPVTVARMVPLFALTPVAFHFGGLIAAAWAIALAPLASVPLHLYLLKRNGLLDLRKEIVTLPLALLGYLAGRAFTGLLG